MTARPLPDGFAPYEWAPPLEEIAARHGLDPAEIIRFDQNVPPLPGVPQVPLGESFARLNEYPDGTYRELREAAAAYAGVEPEQIVPGAGADGLIALAARTFLGPGRTAFVEQPAYPVYAVATGIEGAELTDDPAGGRPRLGLQPEQPDRRARRAGGDRRARTVAPGRGGGRRRGVLRVRREDGRAARRGDAEPDRAPDALEGVRPRRAARRLRDRLARGRARARTAGATRRPCPRRPRASPPPRSAIRGSTSRRRSPSASGCATALLAAGFDCPPSAGNFVVVRGADRADELEAQGLVVRRRVDGFRITVRLAGRERPDPRGARRRARALAHPLGARRPHDRRDRAPHLARSRRAGAAPGSPPGSASSTTCSRCSPSTAGSTSS